MRRPSWLAIGVVVAVIAGIALGVWVFNGLT